MFRVREEEIPRLALMTAAFFVTSTVSPPLPLHTSVHLLLNGLTRRHARHPRRAGDPGRTPFSVRLPRARRPRNARRQRLRPDDPGDRDHRFFRLLDRPAVSNSPLGGGGCVFASTFLMFGCAGRDRAGDCSARRRSDARRHDSHPLGRSTDRARRTRRCQHDRGRLRGAAGRTGPGFPLGCLLGICSV